MKKKVIILGGGVAGMSAAQELAERGFNVAIYEARNIPGGKARSIPVPNSSKNGKKNLPGEHGFRFFPGFYQHITDTMKRVPYKNNPHGVFDNLIGATRISIPRFDKQGLTLPAKFPTNINDLKLLLNTFLQLISNQVELEEKEFKFFVKKIWQLITSCKGRRLGEYEKVDWWNFLEADRFSNEYKNLLVKGLTESLVASKAKLASTKTVGDIFLQLLLDIINPTISTDRLLNGPTNEVWIEPWLAHLKTFGVDYYPEKLVTSINYKDGKIDNAEIQDLVTNEIYTVQGDYYIAAFPVEVMAKLIIKSNLAQYDTTFQNIITLSENVAWMNGIQFYLKEDVEITHGHILFVDTPWALTAISQKQFWPDVDLSEYGDGQVKGIISVDISDWGSFSNFREDRTESTGIKIKKFARDCTDEEIKEEVWEELKRSLNVDGKEILKDVHLHSWFLDPDLVDIKGELLPDPRRQLFRWISAQPEEEITLEKITENLHEDMEKVSKELKALIRLGFIEEIEKPEGGKAYKIKINIAKEQKKINLEPLLVNLVNTWQLRPDAFTKIPNLFLASDYVRTNTDLATMEGANEAARRAVNAILELSGSCACPCQIWELHEPEIFAPLRWHDYFRYQKGLPWEDLLHVEKFLNL